MTERVPSPCLDQLRLSKALSLGPNPVEARHLEECERCRGEWQVLERTRGLLKDLPTAELSPDRGRLLRDAILVKSSALAERRRPARVWLLASTGLAACLALLVVAKGWFADFPAPRPVAIIAVERGTIAPQGPAVFTRASAQPDELVRVSEGTLHLKVRHLNPGERFRVVTSDAEVEVRGTAFQVRAHENRLLSVRVSEGLVEVRPTGKPIMLLGPGNEWHAQETPPAQPPAVVSVETPRPATSAPARIAYAAPKSAATPRARDIAEPEARPESNGTPPLSEKPAPSPAPTDAVERQFQLGWSALRAHNHKEAARAFAVAASQAGEQPLAEDASFWHAVALERAAHDEAARTALAIFIARYPRSPRVGEASALLGWLLLENGDKAGASARFRAAMTDPVERVRSSASAGLQAVERR
jgi:TolA-binding protein